ncbi:response regulator, partial [Vibrio parahaemolyticus V-223/04]
SGCRRKRAGCCRKGTRQRL